MSEGGIQGPYGVFGVGPAVVWLLFTHGSNCLGWQGRAWDGRAGPTGKSRATARQLTDMCPGKCAPDSQDVNGKPERQERGLCGRVIARRSSSSPRLHKLPVGRSVRMGAEPVTFVLAHPESHYPWVMMSFLLATGDVKTQQP